jgi:hypothetical protein
MFYILKLLNDFSMLGKKDQIKSQAPTQSESRNNDEVG